MVFVRQLMIGFVAAVMSAGCVPIPLADPPPFEEEYIVDARPGMSRADVVFALGAPEHVHDGERVFVYAGTEYKMGWVIVLGGASGPGGGAGYGAITKLFLLVLEFDDEDKVLHTDVLDLGYGAELEGQDGGQASPDGMHCTYWDLCLRGEGAVLIPGVETETADR